MWTVRAEGWGHSTKCGGEASGDGTKHPPEIREGLVTGIWGATGPRRVGTEARWLRAEGAGTQSMAAREH